LLWGKNFARSVWWLLKIVKNFACSGERNSLPQEYGNIRDD